MIRRKRRRAYTILEIISLMTVASLLLMASSRVLQLSYKSHRAALGHLAEIEALNQITHRIRNDADRATVFSTGNQIELSSTDRRVRYAQDGDFLIRTWTTTPTATGETNTPADGQQRWRLPDGADVSWSLDAAQERLLLRCGMQFPDSQRGDFAWDFLLPNVASAGESNENEPGNQSQQSEEQVDE